MRAVLDFYGAENCREQLNRDGTTEIIHSCLLERVEPHHAHGDRSPSAAANVDKKLYTCYSYWGGSIISLIQKLEDKDSLDDAVAGIKQFVHGRTTEHRDIMAEWQRIVDRIETGGVYVPELSEYSERILVPWAWVHPYLETRGIDSDTASRLHIGWREDLNRITIPHWWEGSLVGWQMRAIPGEDKTVHPPVPFDWPATDPPKPKYQSSPGFPKSDTLYSPSTRGVIDFPSAIVVESPFSVIKAEALGLKIPVVATFGASMTANQLALLANFKRLWIWMDDDTPGRLAERKLVDYMFKMSPATVWVVTPDFNTDLGDASCLEDVHRKLDQAELEAMARVRYAKEDRRVGKEEGKPKDVRRR